jgi:mannose-1-phosphate guanylyltransferase
MAFFPSDHYYSDHAAFASTVESAIRFAEMHPDSLILLGAEPRYPEVEYGWIEPGPPVLTEGHPSLLRVSRFWEKPPLKKACELLSTGCLWNTFVGVGSANAFLQLLCSTVPATVAKIVGTLFRDDIGGIYDSLNTVDFSRDVLTSESHRLLVVPDARSGWPDFGSPRCVIDTLVQNKIEPEWLREMNGSDTQVAR